MSRHDPAVVIDENVPRLRGVLERLSEKSIEARGFSDPRAGLRHVRDQGTPLLFVSATIRDVSAEQIARAARTAYEGPLKIVLCGAACPEGGPFDDAVLSRAPDDLVALCAGVLEVPAPAEAPVADAEEEGEEGEDERLEAAEPRVLPREPQAPLRVVPAVQRYVPPPAVAAPPPPPAPPEAPGPHVARPTPMADVFARYRVR